MLAWPGLLVLSSHDLFGWPVDPAVWGLAAKATPLAAKVSETQSVRGVARCFMMVSRFAVPARGINNVDTTKFPAAAENGGQLQGTKADGRSGFCCSRSG